MRIQFDPAALVMRGPGPDEDVQMALSSERAYTLAPGSTEVKQDQVLTFPDGIWRLDTLFTATPGANAGTVSIANLNPGLASLDGNRLVALDDGLGYLEVQCRFGRQLHRYRVNVGLTSQVEVAPLAGSLAAALTNGMVAALQGATPGPAAMYLFSTDATPPAASVLSATRVFPSVDFSCVSYRRDNAYNFPCTLISPWHAVSAAHTQVGGTYTFRRPDGSYQAVTVASVVFSAADLTVFRFTAPVTGIAPARVLPADYKRWLPSGQPVPCMNLQAVGRSALGLTRNGARLVPMWMLAQGMPHDGVPYSSFGNVPGSALAPWYTEPIGGDSSSPFVLMLPQPTAGIQLVLAAVAHHGYGNADGVSIEGQIAGLQSALAAKGESLAFADLAAWPTFS